jgi:ribosome biogenesis GTPase
VGDRVSVKLLASEQGVIESVEPRRNLFQRAEQHRTKRLAANVDQLAVVIAAEPAFSEDLVLRMMIAAQVEGISCALIANKSDLIDAWKHFRTRLAVIESLGYAVFEVSVKHDPAQALGTLSPWFQGKTTVLAGQSGMGKSSLVNLLAPHADQATQTISTALGSGKHTTTSARQFSFGHGWSGALIDTPGFQTFGIDHISASERVHAMPEYQALPRCRFYNCTHREEPGCEIRAAAEAGQVDARRYALFRSLID